MDEIPELSSTAKDWLDKIAIQNKGGVPNADKIAFYLGTNMEVAKRWRTTYIEENRPFLERLRSTPSSQDVQQKSLEAKASVSTSSSTESQEKLESSEEVLEQGSSSQSTSTSSESADSQEPLPTSQKVESSESTSSSTKKSLKWTDIFHIHTYINKETVKWGFGILAGLLAYRDFSYYHAFFNKFDPTSAWISAAIGVSALLMCPIVLIELKKSNKWGGIIFIGLVYASVMLFTGYVTYDSVITARSEVVSSQNSSLSSTLKDQASLTQYKKEEAEAEGYVKTANDTINSVIPKSPDELGVLKTDQNYKQVLAKYSSDLSSIRTAKDTLKKYTSKLEDIRPKIRELTATTDQTVKAVEDSAGDMSKMFIIAWSVVLDVLGPVAVYVTYFL